MASAGKSVEPIGLIAGWGRFPVLFAQKMHASGRPVVCVGIRGLARKEDYLPFVSAFHWTRLATLSRPIRAFRKEGVREFTMAGKIHKTILYSPFLFWHLLPDWRMIRYWTRQRKKDNRDDGILSSFVSYFEKEGFQVESAVQACPELLARTGVLTKQGPTPEQEKDIEFGWSMAKEMGRLDIGQTVLVKDGVVLAVEAVEGTDAAIARAGELCRKGGFTMVKVAKPQQDMRFDVPTVGTRTIESLISARGRVLAIEAGQTIILDEAETVSLAEKHGIVIVAR